MSVPIVPDYFLMMPPRSKISPALVQTR